MGHQERRIRQKEELKQSILDAAKKIASKEGWQAVTIRKIADAIQYTPPIVYEYFESKEVLIGELVYSGFRILSAQTLKARQMETDPRKLLLNLSLISWDFAFSHKELFQLMFSLERPVPNQQMISMFETIDDVFLKIAKDNTELSQELLLNWICLNHGAITVMMQTEAPSRQFRKLPPRENFAKMVRRFISSI